MLWNIHREHKEKFQQGHKTQIDSSKNEHSNRNEADKGTPDDLVAKRKTEKRCTRCHLLYYGWRECRKEAVVATAFINRKGQDRSKPSFKPGTSTLAVPQPRPQPPKPTAKVNQIQRLSPPNQVWELSDTKMSFWSSQIIGFPKPISPTRPRLVDRPWRDSLYP